MVQLAWIIEQFSARQASSTGHPAVPCEGHWLRHRGCPFLYRGEAEGTTYRTERSALLSTQVAADGSLKEIPCCFLPHPRCPQRGGRLHCSTYHVVLYDPFKCLWPCRSARCLKEAMASSCHLFRASRSPRCTVDTSRGFWKGFCKGRDSSQQGLKEEQRGRGSRQRNSKCEIHWCEASYGAASASVCNADREDQAGEDMGPDHNEHVLSQAWAFYPYLK